MNQHLSEIDVDPALRPGAFNAVNVCLRLQPDERVTLITDEATSEIAAALVSEIEKVGARFTVFVLENLMPRPLVHMPPAILDDLHKSDVSILLNEEKIPIKKQVNAICEMLGLDPYGIASEGRALMSVDPNRAEDILSKIKLTSIGKDAEIIGTVKSDNPKRVLLNTIVGGTRFVDMPLGEPIPRIC